MRRGLRRCHAKWCPCLTHLMFVSRQSTPSFFLVCSKLQSARKLKRHLVSEIRCRMEYLAAGLRQAHPIYKRGSAFSPCTLETTTATTTTCRQLAGQGGGRGASQRREWCRRCQQQAERTGLDFERLRDRKAPGAREIWQGTQEGRSEGEGRFMLMLWTTAKGGAGDYLGTWSPLLWLLQLITEAVSIPLMFFLKY